MPTPAFPAVLTMADLSDPVVVLVHGAFTESAMWDGVIRRLRADGVGVLAMANPLRGLRHDSTALGGVVDDIGGPVVLVGHGYGGMVITEAAGGRDVRALVFVAAFAPERGESASGLSGRFPGSTLEETLTGVSLPGGGTDLYIARERFRDQFAGDIPAEEAASMAAAQRPCAEPVLGEAAVDEASWKRIPSWFVFGDGDRYIPVAAHRFMAARADARGTREIAGASHAVGVSHPGAVAATVGTAIAATHRAYVPGGGQL